MSKILKVAILSAIFTLSLSLQALAYRGSGRVPDTRKEEPSLNNDVEGSWMIIVDGVDHMRFTGTVENFNIRFNLVCRSYPYSIVTSREL